MNSENPKSPSGSPTLAQLREQIDAIDQRDTDFQNRAHFYAIAARLIRPNVEEPATAAVHITPDRRAPPIPSMRASAPAR